MKKLLTLLLVLLACSCNSKANTDVSIKYDNSLNNTISQMFVKEQVDYIEAKETLDKMVERKLFEERVAAEKARIEEEKRLAELARIEALPVNFDATFNFIDVGTGECQSWIDADYVTQYWGDFYHHNTKKFMNLFNKLKVGKQVIIGGNTYTVTKVTTGWMTSDHKAMYTDDGEAVAYSTDRKEIITCRGSGYTLLRNIAFLE